MSRRRQDEEPFGSDSFLDVLANIVGILIILIVSAAARMGRAPDPVPVVAVPAEIAPAEKKVPVVAVIPEPEPAPVQVAPVLEADEAPAEVASELKNLSEKVAALDAKSRAARTKLDALRDQAQAAGESLTAEEKAAARRAAKIKQAQMQLARLEEALGERKQSLTGLLAEFEEAKDARAPAVEVKHRLTPISQEVAGEELYFRLKGGKVSVVPMAALVERVKAQIERQKGFVVSSGRHESVVGPVDGYTMHYLIERQQLSARDLNRLGYGAYKFGVTHWEVIPETDVFTETPEQALRRGSRFGLAVRNAPDHAMLTFFVYPDSFKAFRTLQAACQAEGFTVAGRPLPEGIGIAGSPDGTRSAGQ
jgi:hypothetical protein